MSCLAAPFRWLQQSLREPTTIGAILLPLIIIVAFKKMSEPQYSFGYYKKLYRERRDEFRQNEASIEELNKWKARNNDFEYEEEL